jgi:hypothetical protein
MSLGLLLLALSSCYLAGRRSLTAGVSIVLTFGYLNGWIRANYLSIYTTLMFDGAVFGFYCGILPVLLKRSSRERPRLRKWFLCLLIWPTLLLAIPVHDPLIQLLGWRAEVWVLPMLLVGACLQPRDLYRLANSVAVLNLVALSAGVFLYFRGIEALYPRNSITELMFRSNDVAGGHSRIPSTFLSAHAYGGAMLQSLPILLAGLQQSLVERGPQWLIIGGAAASVAGLLLCGAKLPMALLILASLVCWYRSGLSMRGLLATLAVFGVVLAIAATNPRLQRFFDLRDPDLLVGRLYASNNEGTWELLTNYPLGAGMGAGAPSIPYFLIDRAPVVPLSENEFTRISMDLGWPGLGLWLAFLFWLLFTAERPAKRNLRWQQTVCYGFVTAAWCSAFIGLGLLVAIPANVFLLLEMGLLAQSPLKGRSDSINDLPEHELAIK